MSDFDKWYDNHEFTVHETEEAMFREYCRQSWNAAWEAAIEKCAEAHLRCAESIRAIKGEISDTPQTAAPT